MEVLKKAKRMLGKKLNKEDKSDLLVHYTECVQPESKTDSNKIVLQPQPVPVKIADQLSSKIGVLAENAALKYSYPIGENADCNKTETIKPIPKPRQKSGQSLKIDANENLQQNPQPCQRLCKALNIDAKENVKPLPPPRKRNNVSQRRKHESLQICDKENVKPKSSKTRQDTSVLRSPHNENINQSTSLSNSLTKMNLNKTLQKPTPLEGWKDSILSIPRKWLSTAESVDEFGFPDTLPKVPVPPLEQTMADYLRALEPITTQAQLERTKALIKEFTAPDGLGPKLHQYLLEKREAEDNWAYYYWLNDMYMDIRLPLPINSNPGMVLPPRRFTTVHDVARFAARILDGIMLHKEMLESGKLPQERAASREKNQPLCMTQYYRLLGSCRRPGIERDSQYLPRVQTPFLIHLSIEDEDQHVIVICRNQMYCVVLKATDRGKLSESEMASQILYVLSDAPCLPAKPPPVGLLTAEPRPIWAQDRAILMQSVQNQRNIDLIETALIVLCLDEPLPTIFNARGFTGATPSVHKSGDRDETNMAHEMIHGGGSEYNSANRWFDKTMQIIICTDGTWGLCYEHSTSEGIAVVQLLEKIFKNILENPSEDNGVPQHHLPPPERLEWEVAPQIKQRFKQAVITVDKAIDNLDFYVYRYQGYGKNFIKASQVSPDVYIQLSLQLAYFKLYGKLVTTYESASTRRFLLGRVDCIRSASSEALEWAKAMCQGEGANVPLESDREDEEDSRKVHFSIYSKDHLRELFRCAVARQTEVMVQNILGNGIDIPLLGLREASRELEGQLHELFTDESYKIANCFLLSTSQVACSTDSFMGYGPVTPRGYGCSYNPHPDQIVFCVSAFYSCEDTSASRYAKSLQESLDIMRDLLKN